jgi:hypothetical protein
MRLPAMVSVLLTATLLSGCGGGSSSHTARVTHESGTTTALQAARIKEHEAVVAAVVACTQGVNTAPWLSQTSKAEFYSTCNGGLGRDIAEARRYAFEVCNEIAYISPYKSTAERARVFSDCFAGIRRQETAAIGHQ